MARYNMAMTTPPPPAVSAPGVVDIGVGRHTWPLQLRPDARVELRRAADPARAAGPPRELVRAALERPAGLDAPLRRAVTPDDRVAVVLDEALPHVAELLAGVIEHLVSAGVAPEAITVVVPPGGTGAGWVDDLPDEFADIRLEVHDLEDKKKIAYVATTKAGRRVYLNRTLAESDFIVTLTGRRFDPTFGYAGAEAAIFPALADPDAAAAVVGTFNTRPPADTPTPARIEAAEVMRLLGAPLLVQVIEGYGDTVADVVATLADRTADGTRRQDASWRADAADAPNLVVAAVSGDPSRVRFLDLALAAVAGSRVVKPGGRVAVLCDAGPPVGEGVEIIREAADPEDVAGVLKKRKPDDWPAAAAWAKAARSCNLFLASRYPAELVEELFATPLASAAEVQRLCDAADKVLVVRDAHKTIIELA